MFHTHCQFDKYVSNISKLLKKKVHRNSSQSYLFTFFLICVYVHIMEFIQMNQKHVKQAVRGQRQIYEENRSTILSYVLASICSSILVFSLTYFLFSSSTTGAWVGLVLSAVCELSAVGFMLKMSKCVRNEKDQIVDAGLDLNDPGAIGEYCKDIVILNVLIQLLSLISAYFYLLLLIIPGFAFFKLWTKILAPWFFAPAPDSDEGDAGGKRKQKRKEKTVYLRR